MNICSIHYLTDTHERILQDLSTTHFTVLFSYPGWVPIILTKQISTPQCHRTDSKHPTQ